MSLRAAIQGAQARAKKRKKGELGWRVQTVKEHRRSKKVALYIRKVKVSKARV